MCGDAVSDPERFSGRRSNGIAMSDIGDDVRAAFEEHGYEVAGVSTNRDRYRVELLEERADAADLRTITTDAVGDGVVGLDVSTEAVEGADGVRTVVSFRHRV